MPSAVDFFLSGDQGAARDLTVTALTDAGLRVSKTADGNLLAERGSLGMTVAFGALAGKSRFHVKFPVAFYAAPDGGLVVRISRDAGMGAVKGGAIGLNMTNNAFVDTTEAVRRTFEASGTLTNAVPQG